MSSLSLRRIVQFLGGSPFSVIIIPCRKDNYAYLVVDKESSTALAIDPVEPEKVVTALGNSTLVAIANTHHHEDHSGGNFKMHKHFPSAPIYGFDERIDGSTVLLQDGQSFRLGSLRISAMHTPCHTTGCLSYVIHDDKMTPSAQAVFTGDTMFIAGCGRFFEGTPSDMYTSLVKKIGSLPATTKTFVGHEYTLNNLRFALSIEPGNEDAVRMVERIKQGLPVSSLDDRGEGPFTLLCDEIISVPGTIRDEWNVNPFMRVDQVSIQNSLGELGPIATMEKLRSLKNAFL